MQTESVVQVQHQASMCSGALQPAASELGIRTLCWRETIVLSESCRKVITCLTLIGLFAPVIPSLARKSQINIRSGSRITTEAQRSLTDPTYRTLHRARGRCFTRCPSGGRGVQRIAERAQEELSTLLCKRRREIIDTVRSERRRSSTHNLAREQEFRTQLGAE